VSADGGWQIWEPHGLISECILSSAEPRRAWLGCLSANARARQAWCEQRGYAHVRSTAALSELVEEIDASLADLCR